MAEFEPSEQFASFFFLAIDHAFASIEDEIGPLIPFVMFVDRAGDRTLQRFVAEQLEEAVEQAHGFILENQSAWQMYALAWDGFITIEGKRTDGLFIEAGERGDSDAVLFCQRYVPAAKKFFRTTKAQRIGNPGVVERPKSRLEVVV